MEYIGNWKFWFAVVVVVFISHFVMSAVIPKLTGGE